MIVAQINAYDCGSTGKIMIQIAKISRQNGIEAYTFSSSRASKNHGTPNHIYIDYYLDYRLHMVLGMLSGYEMEFSYFATRRLIKELKKINPDIIHLHNTHGWYLNHKLLFSYIKNNNIKVVWTLHDCWAFTGRCPYFQITGCQKWRDGCSRCVYDKKMYPQSFLVDQSKQQWIRKKKMFTGIKEITVVTPSQWLADLVKQSYLKDYPVKVINNGIDLSVFKQKPSDFRIKYHCEDKNIILGIAFSWGKRKGLDVFIELSKRLNDKYQIVLVGTNEIVDKELPNNIISIHRTQNQGELAEIYSVANLFVNPTREDNFPTVNMESLACGTPVLTFRTGGSPEMLDESCGSVIDCDDINGMENEIIRICTYNPYLIEACLARSKMFDMNNKFIEYVRLYKTIWEDGNCE